jgi:hypothetical protein
LFSSAFSFKLKKQGGSYFHSVPKAIFVQANYGAKKHTVCQSKSMPDEAT